MSGKRVLVFAGAALAAVVLAVAAIVVVQLLRGDDPDLLTEAPAIPTQAASTSPAAGGATPSATARGALPAGVLHFAIDASGSKATYVVREKLTRLPVETDAVGETTAVSGDLYLTREGLHSGIQSTFRVDLRTLRSDESLRDNFIRGNTLQTNRFPFAEFTIESVAGFPRSYAEGSEVSVTLTGSMTIKGVTRSVTFQVKARHAGGALTAVADTTFKMSDFGITPPEVALARSHDEVRLQVVILARQAVS